MRIIVMVTCLFSLMMNSFAENKEAGAEKENSESNPKRISPEPYEIRTNSIGMEFVWIPAGEFMMGRKHSEEELKRKYFDAMISEGVGSFWSDEKIKSEVPRHSVKIEKGFWMGRYEVTQAQYKCILGEEKGFKCPHCKKYYDPFEIKSELPSDAMQNHPVCDIIWFQAMEFCRRLGDKEGREYSLPTEAQWEYACRAGTTTCFSFGDDYSELGEYAWYDGNSEGTTHPVGQKKPNAWGLFDMHGNVSEWCLDRYDPNFYTTEVVVNPLCLNAVFLKTDARVVRGGSFMLDIFCRSASRNWFHNHYLLPAFETGFRVVCEEL